MDYESWERSIPEEIRADSLWRMSVYRLALFLADIGWHDVTKLTRDRRTIALSDQLYRALGSVSANIAEGYSRGSGRDRARFYEYALGSARESRDWYFKSRHLLGEVVFRHRLQILTSVTRLLLTIIPKERKHTIREGESLYRVTSDINAEASMGFPEELTALLINIPLLT